MSGETLYDSDAPTLEVRIYDHGRLVTTELCESEDDAAGVVERWSEMANLFVVADDLSATHEPDDILAPEAPVSEVDEHDPIANTPLPGCGTE